MQRILVIDDDEAVRSSYELALEDSPYEVLTADGCSAGLAILSNNSVELIFLDLKMPRTNGIETLRYIRAGGCNAIVYIATGFAEEFIEQLQAVAAEGLTFELLRKPLEPELINEIVEFALSRAREQAQPDSRH